MTTETKALESKAQIINPKFLAIWSRARIGYRYQWGPGGGSDGWVIQLGDLNNPVTAKAHIKHTFEIITTSKAHLMLDHVDIGEGWYSSSKDITPQASIYGTCPAPATIASKANLRSGIGKNISGKAFISRTPLEYWYYLKGGDVNIEAGTSDPLLVMQEIQSIELSVNYAIDYPSLCEWHWYASNNYGEVSDKYEDILPDVILGEKYGLTYDHLKVSPLVPPRVEDANDQTLYEDITHYTIDTDAGTITILDVVGGIVEHSYLKVSYEIENAIDYTVWEEVGMIVNQPKSHYVFKRLRSDGKDKTIWNQFGLALQVITTGATFKLFDYNIIFDYYHHRKTGLVIYVKDIWSCASITWNLLSNEDWSFEGGTVGDWGTLVFCNLESSTEQSYIGTHSAKMTATDPGNIGFSNNITSITSKSKQYTASAKFKSESGGTYRIYLYDGSYAYGPEVVADGAWQTMAVTKTFGTGNLRKLVFEEQSGLKDDVTYWDDIQLLESP